MSWRRLCACEAATPLPSATATGYVHPSVKVSPPVLRWGLDVMQPVMSGSVTTKVAQQLCRPPPLEPCALRRCAQ
eukprot:6086599-Prymnesium_polylepis.4